MVSRRQFVTLLSLALTCPALAQGTSGNWPKGGPIRLVVPFTPGGAADMLARHLQPHLSEALGQTVTVENRAGGATIIGTGAVAQGAADGHMLLFIANSFTINATLFPNAPFNAQKDFSGIGAIGVNPHVLVVKSGFEADTLEDLLRIARAEPDRLTYASFGNGTSAHLGGESFKIATGTQILHVPYKGAAPAMQDVIAGEVDMMFNNLPDTLPMIRSGRLKALAIASDRRADVLPDVPTFKESGLPEVVSNSWFGLVARSETPSEIKDRLNEALRKVLSNPAVLARFATIGIEPQLMSRQEFDAHLAAELKRNAAIITRANIQVG